ncbi:hypothetical protein LPJ79_004873 [Coemansia sp. RSA 1821]|nr:hypothetical protein LPJ79_004873 [Coemansia sp. RSA 1821]
MHCDFNKLPPQALTRIFEYLFWQGMRGNEEVERLVLPIGQFTLLPCLQVSHDWRKRAARLFYRTAVLALGTSDTVSTVTGVYRARTNIKLILESGYAPKSTRLAVFAIGRVLPDDLAECLLASEFADYEWPLIDTLYFYHPQTPNFSQGRVPGEQDVSIDDANRYLLTSMPGLKRVCALSGTCDSFGLYALDDLIDERMPYLQELTAIAQGPLKLGFHGSAHQLKQLTMHTIASGCSMRPSCSDYASSIASHETAKADNESDLEAHTVAPAAVTLDVPRIYAETLVSLDIGPIEPESIWSSFFGSSGISGQPDLLAAPNFTALRRLRLVFGCKRMSVGEESISRRKARKANRQHASPGPTNAVVNGIYPLFPLLESLCVERYPFNILLFLENFPRSRLRHLEIHKCAHRFYKLSLGVFTSLTTAIIDVPEAPHARKEEDEEDWISKAFGERISTLRRLTLMTYSVSHQIDLPARFYHLTQLQHLDLAIGMRSVEIEKLLTELKQLRTLRVVITEVLSKAHEYLSRNVRRKKYPKSSLSRSTLSTSLEILSIRLVGLSAGRRRRALAKAAWAAARSPSMLRIETQEEYLPELHTCMDKQFIASSLLFYSVYFVCCAIYRAYATPLRHVPGPFVNKFTNLPLRFQVFRGKYHTYTISLHAKYGQVVRVGYNKVSVSNVSELKRILATHKYVKGKHYEQGLFLPPTIFSTTSSEHNRKRRRQMGATYTMRSMQQLQDKVIEMGAHALMSEWDRQIGREVNYFYGFHSIAVDIIGALGFGDSFGILKHNDRRIIDGLHKMVKLVVMRSCVGLLGRFPWLAKSLNQGRLYVTGVAENAIAKRLAQMHEKPVDILQKLIDAHDPVTHENIRGLHLTSEITLLLVAGTDTTSNTLSWTLMQLLHHPAIMRRLQTDIREAFPDPSQTVRFEEAREKLPFLTAVIYESMRLHPAVSGYLTRVVPQNGTTLGSHYVPHLTEICISFAACHRDPETWNSPDLFDPWRFMGPEAEHNKRNILAFSSGVRMCIGRNLAWIELYTVLANILRRYRFSLPRDSPYGPHRLAGTKDRPESIPGLAFTTFGPENPSSNCRVNITLAG